MNIFYLHKHPEICAKMHGNKHVVKMILETAQMLCTAHFLYPSKTLNYDRVKLYKPTHKNHPSTKWVTQSLHHYHWLVKLGLCLCREYTLRYRKVHATQSMMMFLAQNVPNLPSVSFEDPPQAMPDEWKGNDCVMAYRKYYINEKTKLLQYSTKHYKRTRPHFVSFAISQIKEKKIFSTVK